MRSTTTSTRSRGYSVRPDLMILVAVALCLVGCDKKAGGQVSDSVDQVSEKSDLPVPLPVVLTPDTYPGASDAQVVESVADASAVVEVRVLEGSLGPVEGDAGSLTLIRKQGKRIEDKSRQLEDMQVRAVEAKRLIKVRKGLGKRSYERWRKRQGKKLPPMPSLEHLEQKTLELKTSIPGLFKIQPQPLKQRLDL